MVLQIPLHSWFSALYLQNQTLTPNVRDYFTVSVSFSRPASAAHLWAGRWAPLLAPEKTAVRGCKGLCVALLCCGFSWFFKAIKHRKNTLWDAFPKPYVVHSWLGFSDSPCPSSSRFQPLDPGSLKATHGQPSQLRKKSSFSLDLCSSPSTLCPVPRVHVPSLLLLKFCLFLFL